MATDIVNLFVIIAVGVILADLIAHGKATGTLFCNLANVWRISISGMLGQEAKTVQC
jgi:hypothetical protein